jgi:hypothetical protein
VVLAHLNHRLVQMVPRQRQAIASSDGSSGARPYSPFSSHDRPCPFALRQ